MALSNQNARLQGVTGTINKLRKFGSIGENRIRIISQTIANEIADDAKSRISSYPGEIGGKIASSIVTAPTNDGLTWTVKVGETPMSAYIEFGTGIFVEVPKGWEDIAWSFYVNGKGYTRPYPYFYPAYYIGRRQYKKDLKDSLNYLISRFNSNGI